MIAPMQAMAALITPADPPLVRKRRTTISGDAALMAAFLRKEPDAARQLYDRFASRIYGLGLFLLRNKTDAEDLVQDTFLKIWRGGVGVRSRSRVARHVDPAQRSQPRDRSPPSSVRRSTEAVFSAAGLGSVR